MMPSRCSIQYVSKFGRPSNGHRTGKGQSSSQFPRSVVLKNMLTTGQLHSSPMLIRSCLKSCMLGFSIMRTKNFQMSTCMCAKSLQSCPTLCNPMDCSLPGSSVHGIPQARVLEWVVMPSSRESSQPRDRTHISDVSCIGRQVLYHYLGSQRKRNQRSNCQHSQITDKDREFQENIYLCLTDYPKAFDSTNHDKLWKALNELGIPDHLTCLLSNLMWVKEQH